MRIFYYSETDSLYIELMEKPGVDSQEIVAGIVLDFDNDGYLVGIDIDQASKSVNFTRIEANSLPLRDFALS